MKLNGYRIVSEAINYNDDKPKRNIPAATAAGIGSVLAARSAIPRIMGYKDVYHGTTNDAAEKIRQQGLDPNFGGTEGGIANTFKTQRNAQGPVKLSKGHIYVSPNKTIAQQNANIAQSKNTILATQKGSVIHAQIPYQKFAKAFEADPEYVLSLKPELMQKLQRMALEKDGAEKVSQELQRIAPELSKSKAGKITKHIMAARSKEGIAAKDIIGGKGSSFLSRSKDKLRNLPGYIKNHPGRFAAGAGLAAGSAYLAKKAYDKINPKQEK